MFRRISEDIIFLLVKNKRLDIKKREIYTYGLEVILLNSAVFVFCLLLSLFMKNMIHFLVFIVAFIPVRMMGGGYHAKSSGSCLMSSGISYFITLLIVYMVQSRYHLMYIINVLVLALIIIFAFAPVVNRSHKIPKRKIARNKVILFSVVGVETLIAVALFSKVPVATVSYATFIGWNALLILLSKMEERKNVGKIV